MKVFYGPETKKKSPGNPKDVLKRKQVKKKKVCTCRGVSPPSFRRRQTETGPRVWERDCRLWQTPRRCGLEGRPGLLRRCFTHLWRNRRPQSRTSEPSRVKCEDLAGSHEPAGSGSLMSHTEWFKMLSRPEPGPSVQEIPLHDRQRHLIPDQPGESLLHFASIKKIRTNVLHKYEDKNNLDRTNLVWI